MTENTPSPLGNVISIDDNDPRRRIYGVRRQSTHNAAG